MGTDSTLSRSLTVSSGAEMISPVPFLSYGKRAERVMETSEVRGWWETMKMGES